ncbi:MAG: branched-chain amino acid aminotransferase [Proteobacteria bacterium]|nr:branched-chain amino acid aminotransferase [Pseudomonadota bacterium]
MLIPFDDRDGFIWLDGKMVPWREAKVHVLTHALHYASSVFEGERAYKGKVFKLSEHSQRLHRSAELLGFTLPYSVTELNAATEAVIKANNMPDAYIRPVAWRGAEVMGIAAQQAKIHVAIACWNWPSYFSPEQRMKGLRLTRAEWARPAPNTAPTASKAAGLYMICTLSRHMADTKGFDDALMLDWRGQVAEATAANFFMVQDGKLHTPTADCFLNGITRQTVIELARQNGIEVIERAIWPDELKSASEIFLTGTAAEISPVGQIDELTFTPGAITQRLIQAYDRAKE